MIWYLCQSTMGQRHLAFFYDLEDFSTLQVKTSVFKNLGSISDKIAVIKQCPVAFDFGLKYFYYHILDDWQTTRAYINIYLLRRRLCIQIPNGEGACEVVSKPQGKTKKPKTLRSLVLL